MNNVGSVAFFPSEKTSNGIFYQGWRGREKKGGTPPQCKQNQSESHTSELYSTVVSDLLSIYCMGISLWKKNSHSQSISIDYIISFYFIVWIFKNLYELKIWLRSQFLFVFSSLSDISQFDTLCVLLWGARSPSAPCLVLQNKSKSDHMWEVDKCSSMKTRFKVKNGFLTYSVSSLAYK